MRRGAELPPFPSHWHGWLGAFLQKNFRVARPQGTVSSHQDWMRHQPTSELALWYRERFAENGARSRKVGVVAMARKLAIALWHFVEHGIVPSGAILNGR